MDKNVVYVMVILAIVVIIAIVQMNRTETFETFEAVEVPYCESPWVKTTRGCELTCPKGYITEHPNAICPTAITGPFTSKKNDKCPEGTRVAKLSGNREMCIQLMKKCPEGYKLIDSGPDAGTCVITCPNGYDQQHLIWKGQEGSVCQAQVSHQQEAVAPIPIKVATQGPFYARGVKVEVFDVIKDNGEFGALKETINYRGDIWFSNWATPPTKIFGKYSERFGLKITGFIKVPAGKHIFKVGHDDGARLKIGNNSSERWVLTGHVEDVIVEVSNKQETMMPFELQYYQWGGGISLTFKMDNKRVPTTMLYHQVEKQPSVDKPNDFKGYKRIGCFADSSTRAITDATEYGYDNNNYKQKTDPIGQCASFAKSKGFSTFAVQDSGWCATGPDADGPYNKYGQSSACVGGKGGPWANDVYIWDSEAVEQPPVPVKKTTARTTNATILGTNIRGFDMPNMPIRDISLADCHKKCMDDPNCHVITYRESDKECWMKTGNIAKNAITAGTGFTQDTVDFGGFDLPNMPIKDVKDVTECRKLCDTNTECQWVTYNKDNKNCSLKQGVAVDGFISQFKPKWPKLAEGGKTADGYLCTVQGPKMTNGTIANTNIPGFDMPNMPINGVELSECHKKCKETPQCHWINYREKDKNCWLKTGVINQAATTAGSGVLLQNVDIPGFDIPNQPIKSVTTHDECNKLCQISPECQFVTYNNATKDCWLKKGAKSDGIMTQFKQYTIL